MGDGGVGGSAEHGNGIHTSRRPSHWRDETHPRSAVVGQQSFVPRASIKIDAHTGCGHSLCHILRDFGRRIGEIPRVSPDALQQLQPFDPALAQRLSLHGVAHSRRRRLTARTGRLQRFPHLLLHNHLKRFDNRSALRRVRHSDLSVIPRIGQILPSRRKGKTKAGHRISIVDDAKTGKTAARPGQTWVAIRLATDRLGNDIIGKPVRFFFPQPGQSIPPRCIRWYQHPVLSLPLKIIRPTPKKQIHANAHVRRKKSSPRFLLRRRQRSRFTPAVKRRIAEGTTKTVAPRKSTAFFPVVLKGGMVLRLDHFDDLTRSARRAPVQPHRLARSIQIPFLKSFRELTTNRFVVRRDNR